MCLFFQGKVNAGFPNELGQSLQNIIEKIISRKDQLSQLCIIEIDGEVVDELNYDIKGDIAYTGWKICSFITRTVDTGIKSSECCLSFFLQMKTLTLNVP